jgi:inosine-uridine nucleoside N-ribohydrolase
VSGIKKKKQALSFQMSLLCIDTDAGVDDAYALILALRSSRRVDLLTCCAGNCSLQNVKTNVSKVVKLMSFLGSERPRISAGAAGPLSKSHPAIDAGYFHGNDGLGDVPSGTPGEVTLEEGEEEADDNDAPGAIIDLCRRSGEGGVDLVSLGPLTNLALAIQRDVNNELKCKLRRVFIMGGSAGRGNVTRAAEFNMYADPEAASVCFAALSSIEWEPICETTVVPWDLCVESPIPWDVFDKCVWDDAPNRPTLSTLFLKAISTLSYPPPKVRSPSDGKRGGLGAVVCDALTVFLALNPDAILESSRVHVDVELDGTLTRGQTVLDFGHAYDGVERPKAVRWVTKIDQKRYCEAFVSLFAAEEYVPKSLSV